MGRLGEIRENPFLSGPTCHRMHTRAAVRPGKMIVTCHIIDNRIALDVEIDVLNVAISSFLVEITDKSRSLLP